ncbi:hypothetical protein [Corynebacterium vitaeruminis]|uniref:Phenol hydroxylase n=1 Tax=Corynebacterium vitaeruminis DSM 20294 TaxID=1224164 RepID=W5Y472_9CORY|nr:hypothetical protein [Corynebacterium vitaeruminis]AHI23665.1 hypothetical protein B843_11435 [Corynebacterium vitaeruminis DSM 20294]
MSEDEDFGQRRSREDHDSFSPGVGTPTGDFMLHTLSPMRPVPTNAEDNWMDRFADTRAQRRTLAQELWHDSITMPINWATRFFELLRTTPGKMTFMVVTVSLAIVAAGLSMSQTSADRRAALDTLMNNTEPVSYTAHRLYTSLSLADTTATVGFVRSGIQSESTRTRYTQAYQEAATAAAQTASGLSTDNTEAMALITHINQLLPTYTGLVETAWANNRQDNPVGVAYMSEANALMRNDILPAANELYTMMSDEVISSQKALATPLWFPLSGLFAALAFLIIAQIWLASVTHRRLNRGFVFATFLMVFATVWVTTANMLTWSAGAKAYEEASTPLEQLTNARILAQQARTNETLALVRRQAADSSTTSFDSAAQSVEDALDAFGGSLLADAGDNQTHLRNAREALTQWEDNHAKLVDALGQGDYDQALTLALGDSQQTQAPVSSQFDTTTGVGTDNGSVSTAYEVMDSELSTLVGDTRSTLRTYIGKGANASDFVSMVVLILSILSVLSMWIGIRQRLQEYL